MLAILLILTFHMHGGWRHVFPLAHLFLLHCIYIIYMVSLVRTTLLIQLLSARKMPQLIRYCTLLCLPNLSGMYL